MHIFFDCDGTLVDSESLAYRTFQAIAAQHLGLYVSLDIWCEQLLGHSRSHCLEFLEQWYGDSLPVEFAQLLARTLRTALETELQPIACAVDALRDIPYPKYIVSNASQAHVDFVLGKAGIDHCFSRVFSADQGKHAPKPKPDVYLNAMGTLRLSPIECVVVEDSVPGVLSAKAAGLFTIGLSAQSSYALLNGAGANIVVQSMNELPWALSTKLRHQFSHRS
ncbi:Haloacid dehalogenase superfamily, subfamily IA, variant 2 with 3rd motif like haloacid dehalogenase/haloacid dehalogenase superfamily, subfamily IA, variant 3 with third motif having DD or ED [Pseudomonas cedrina]|uniref:HAD family hydrolase n=2 Tax=Pseudomonas cedrina TaxID=651740 RepID=A0A1V2K2A5_PSECE|nr:HAD family phosphatase [Pseudomonas cedrina]ONH51590.1 hypothetical protein BLL36_21980 [Pseudomonas cedrina subsp. cedrina]SDT11510.1 Haloacid dehalogenase superfamily, subfamily IA, variant 2 with 3rd motif like haloacid dehalogenase/haloacid dehalogenase superfamily, subfamily IA, variant 3 with third motif having DD or ED [Pseudomonas cedrina]